MVNNTRDCLLGGCVVYEEVMKGGGGGGGINLALEPNL